MNEVAIPAGWKIVKLGDLGEVNRGRSRHRPRWAPELYGGPYPFVQTGDIKESGGRIAKHSQTYSEEGLAQSRLWPAGTMCITIAANIAETGILTFPACFPDSIVGFIGDKTKCNVRFVEYMFRFLRNRIQFEAADSGSVQDNINLDTLDRLRFPLPPLSEQDRIAGILDSLDDKINLNRQVNRTLESMAKAVFDHWFVDYEFPNEEGKPYRSTGGNMVQNDELRREIPKGWEFSQFSRLIELTMGLSPKGESYNTKGEGMPLINGAADFSGEIITPNKFTTQPTRVCKRGDLLFCIRGTIGNLTYADKPYCMGRGVASISTKNEIYREYVYFVLIKKMSLMTSQAAGSVIVGLSKPDIMNLKLVLPPEPVAREFHSMAENLFARKDVLKTENEKLTDIRNSLLPKLMSGRIIVPVEVR